MTQTVMLFLLLLLFNTGVLAQPSGAAAFAAKDDSGSHDLAELQGCLERDKGVYILVDKSNEFLRLSENKNLQKLVGHEVKLTGKPAVRTIDNTLVGGASSATEQRYLQVKTVQDVTPNCQAYGR
jgi:hypothetical protein